MGHREQAATTVVEAAEMRQRAYTLFLAAYEHAQRAVRFLRWQEEDWDTVAPSIYAANRSARRKDAEEEPTPPAPVPPVTAGDDEAPKAHHNGSQATSPAVGFPGSDPFLPG